MKRLAGLTSVLIFVLMFGMQSCNSVKAIAMQDLELLSSGAYSNLNEKQLLVIKDTEGLESIYKNLSSVEEVPFIDWNQHQVVLLALGTKNTGGYSIEIDSVTKTKDAIQVYYKVTSPKPGDRATMALTAAYALYKIQNKQELPITFKELSQEE